MVQISGDQNIPSAIKLLYQATLTEKGANAFCKKRSPFKLPKMQAGGVHVRDAQIVVRERFKEAVKRFKNTSPEERARWYARMPVWNSFMWYYNYYMLDAITGGLGAVAEGASVINSIQIVNGEVPTTGQKTFNLTTIDASRAVALLFGNSFISDKVQRGFNSVNQNSQVGIAMSPDVDPNLAEVHIQGLHGYWDTTNEGEEIVPYVDALTSQQLTVALPASSFVTGCIFSWEVKENKAQTVYPLPISLTNTVLTVDWAKVPSVPANVSAIVVEYI